MRTISVLISLWLPLLATITRAAPASAAAPPTQPGTIPTSAPAYTEEQAIAALRALGGKIKLEGSSAVSADLGDINITDAGLVYLDSLPKLKSLSLRHAYKGVTDAGFAHLENLSQLQSLDLWDVNAITNAAMRHLQGLGQLQTLSIPGPIGDDGLAMLKDLPHLQTLLITGNGVSDAGLAQLRDFASLRTLSFAFSRITDAGVEPLSKCTRLKVINFGGAKVTDQGIRSCRNRCRTAKSNADR